MQALIKQDESRALYVHCLAHNLNLCVQTVAKQCDLVRNVMDFMYELLQLIKFSPKRLSLFNSVRNDVALGGEASPLLRSICPIRWTVRNDSINSVLRNYANLITILEEVRKGRDEYAAKGNGLLTQMESFETFFGLKLAYLIFSASEQFQLVSKLKILPYRRPHVEQIFWSHTTDHFVLSLSLINFMVMFLSSLLD